MPLKRFIFLSWVDGSSFCFALDGTQLESPRKEITVGRHPYMVDSAAIYDTALRWSSPNRSTLRRSLGYWKYWDGHSIIHSSFHRGLHSHFNDRDCIFQAKCWIHLVKGVRRNKTISHWSGREHRWPSKAGFYYEMVLNFFWVTDPIQNWKEIMDSFSIKVYILTCSQNFADNF